MRLLLSEVVDMIGCGGVRDGGLAELVEEAVDGFVDVVGVATRCLIETSQYSTVGSGGGAGLRCYGVDVAALCIEYAEFIFDGSHVCNTFDYYLICRHGEGVLHWSAGGVPV